MMYQLTTPPLVVEAARATVPTVGGDDLDRVVEASVTWLEKLEHVSGLDVGTLLAAVRRYGRELAAGDVVDDARLQVRDSVLGWTYHKPSIILFEQAFGRVAADIVDAGLATGEAAALPVIRSLFDPDLILASASPRPQEVLPIEPQPVRLTGSERSEWIGAVHTEAIDRVVFESTAWLVLAERTHLRVLEHGIPFEVRDQALRVPEMPLESVFRTLRHTPIAELAGLAQSIGGGLPILAHDDPAFRGPSAWLAFNPETARTLAWEPDPMSLLGWKDSSGELVRSVSWQSGWVDSTPSYDSLEVGRGWLVLATERAVGQLVEHFGDLVVAARFERGFLSSPSDAVVRPSERTLAGG